MFESVRVGRSLLLSRALSSSPSASLWHRPDMTGADLGHRVCLAELCSAAASTFLLATALPSGQGLSLGPTATLTLSGAATLAGHGEWDCRWARLTGRLMWDGFTTGRTGDALESKLLLATSQPGKPGLVLANAGASSSQKITIQARFSKFSVHKCDQR
ncbi:hypothetical protein QQF64_013865 [Cirrhinus molitorella]|uniref:Uncharacterized protein n=1 Tax=Cirrhinus molitorella TaxID=172907 RepID=A0ABR3LVL6_9TELE